MPNVRVRNRKTPCGVDNWVIEVYDTIEKNWIMTYDEFSTKEGAMERAKYWKDLSN